MQDFVALNNLDITVDYDLIMESLVKRLNLDNLTQLRKILQQLEFIESKTYYLVTVPADALLEIYDRLNITDLKMWNNLRVLTLRDINRLIDKFEYTSPNITFCNLLNDYQTNSTCRKNEHTGREILRQLNVPEEDFTLIMSETGSKLYFKGVLLFSLASGVFDFRSSVTNTFIDKNNIRTYVDLICQTLSSAAVKTDFFPG